MLLLLAGCWAAWEAGMYLRADGAAARWCVEVRASGTMGERGPPARACPPPTRRGSRGAGLPSPPATTRTAPSCRPGSSSATSCEYLPSFALFYYMYYPLVNVWGCMRYVQKRRPTVYEEFDSGVTCMKLAGWQRKLKNIHLTLSGLQ